MNRSNSFIDNQESKKTPSSSFDQYTDIDKSRLSSRGNYNDKSNLNSDDNINKSGYKTNPHILKGLNIENLDNAQKVKMKMAAFFKNNYSPDRKQESRNSNIITTLDNQGNKITIYRLDAQNSADKLSKHGRPSSDLTM